MAQPGLETGEVAVGAMSGLHLELDQCRREVEAWRKRVGDLEQVEALLAGENRLLEMIAKGCPISDIMTAHCRLIEDLSPGSLCGILLFDPATRRVEHGAAPSLPRPYNDSIHNRIATPEAGPCGMAACWKMQIIAADVASDSRWEAEGWRALALAYGLRACWSSPIFASDGHVLGTFAIYWRNPRSPTERDQKLIGQTTHLAAVAIERMRTESALRESEERFRHMADSVPEVIWFTALNPEKALYVSPSFERVWGIRVQDLYANPRRWVESIHPQDRERVEGVFSRWIAGEAVSYHDLEYRILKPDGETRWIHERGALTLDRTGSPCLASGISTDITERKHSEDQLRRSESGLTEAIDTIPGLVWSVLPDGEVDFLNQRWREYTGLTLEQARGWGWSTVIHPDDLARLETYWRSVLASGKAGEIEARLRRFDGVYRWFLFRAVPLYNAETLVKWYGQNIDIDDRKRAEERLHQSEAYLTEAQRLSQTGSFGLRIASGELVWSDETFCIMGYERATTPTLELVLNRVHPHDLSFVRESIERARHEQADSDFEHRLLMPDGTIKFVRVMARAAKTEHGELEFVGAVMDITDRKKSEEAVRAAKARFEGILEIADDAIISVNSAQRIVLFNQGAEKVFGYSQEEAVGKSLNLLIPPRFLGRHPTHIEDFAAAPEVSRVMGQRRELFGQRKNGEEFPAEASISKLDLGGEWVFTVILRDITERKKAAEALRASEHLARGQLEALASSLSALSRESVPEKFLEHVLRTAGEQLDAAGLSVWEMNELSGCVELAASYQDQVLFLSAKNGGSPSLRLSNTSADHPVWTEFFRTGKHCVFGTIQNGPPWSQVAIHPDGPWHDWRAEMVDNPIVPQLIQDLAATGVVATLNVPMLVADKVAGLFVLCFKQRRPFRLDEIELTRAMSNQAMLAIQLMRLSQANRESAVIAERNRMARDMHDTLAQGFTGVIMQLEAAKGAIANEDATSVSAHIERAEALARTSLNEARRSVRAMRSRSLVDGTLSTALDELLKRMTSGTALQAELAVHGEGRPLPPDWEEGLLRIAQESLTNTIKYAQARHFRAVLSFATQIVRLQLADDGLGFDPQAEHDGFGLVGMRERAEQIAGNFLLRSKPGQGTEILIELNQPDAPHASQENRQD